MIRKIKVHYLPAIHFSCPFCSAWLGFYIAFISNYTFQHATWISTLFFLSEKQALGVYCILCNAVNENPLARNAIKLQHSMNNAINQKYIAEFSRSLCAQGTNRSDTDSHRCVHDSLALHCAWGTMWADCGCSLSFVEFYSLYLHRRNGWY